MQRKEYELIANAIKTHHEENCKGEGKQHMEEFLRWTLLDILKEDNPRFNEAVFLNACWFTWQ